MGSGVEMPPPSADEALSRLIEGNRRFVGGAPRREPFRTETLAALRSAQRPYATVLGCSDSRVPPEWVFDAGLGELFVIRVAGNVLSPEVALGAELRNEGLMFHLILNGFWEPLDFELPPRDGRGPWLRWIDTSRPSPEGIVEWKAAPPVAEGTYRAGPRSAVTLYSETR